MHTARSEGRSAGFTEGFQSGWSAALELVISSGLATEQQVLDLVNTPVGE